MFAYTVETEKSIKEAVEVLEEKLAEEKFGILWQFDIKDKLSEKGLSFDKSFRILEVCNPHEAKNIIEEDVMAGYLLPCKIVVYEDGGKTKIGLLKPTALFSLLNNDKLNEMATHIEGKLISAIDKTASFM